MADFNSKSLKETQKLKRSPSVAAKHIEDESVLLHLETGNYYTLNSTAQAIWSYCGEPRSFLEIIDFITSEYQISKQTADQELRLHIQELLKERILEAV